MQASSGGRGAAPDRVAGAQPLRRCGLRTLLALLLVFVPRTTWAEEVDADRRQLLETLREVEAAEKVREIERRRAKFETSDEGAIARVLDQTRIDLDFADASLEDIIGFIREYAKINIEIDQKVREEGLAEKKTTLRVKDAVLRGVLDTLMREHELRTRVEITEGI